MKEMFDFQKVMVTGATGYVAGWLVKKLLDEGKTVHAAVRDPEKTDKLKYLNAIAEKAPGTIKYFKADLMKPGSYAEAMAGCEVVFHTASPFTVSVKDPQKELIEPAQMGTRNVLEEVNRTDSVKRVVLTSSCAAIYGDSADHRDLKKEVFNEDDWNVSSSLTHQPYSYSKTVAEQEAWKIHDKQERWDLVVINPSLVIGPGINPNGTSESFSIIKQMGDGSMKSGAPRWAMGVVDVRDVAEAHYRAGFLKSAKGRHVTHAHESDFFDMAQLLAKHYGDKYPFPTKVLPKWMVWLLGPMINSAMKRKVISRNVDIPLKLDNSKSVRELGIDYRPYEESMVEFFQQMIDNGLVKPVEGK
jgi:dihydroflavonol-4-reductase